MGQEDIFEQQWQNFCDNITWIRAKYGISKKKMAELLEIGIWTLNKIERGELPPRADVCIFWNVYEHFGIPPAEQLRRRLEDAER